MRKVTCHETDNTTITVLEDEMCPGEKPETTQSCEKVPCTGVDWIVTEWSGVSSNTDLLYLIDFDAY